MSEGVPRPLQLWVAELGFLRVEVADHIGPWLPRLAALLGRRRGSRKHVLLGQPDGYDGLTRRGSYERLLTSEWALADVAPDEFLRRAAEREQLFMEPRRTEPKGAARTIALFDAGPDQLGAPRLVHLAVLLVLARQAAAMGGVLFWGHLQRPDLPLASGVSEANLEGLFAARTHLRPDESAPWEPALLHGADLWVVGGGAHLTGARRVEIADPYLPEARTLTVTLHEEGISQPAVSLSLPDDHLCAIVLRNPLGNFRAPAPLGGSPPSSVRFNLSCTALLIHKGQHLHTIKVSRRGWKRPIVGWVSEDSQLVAVGWFNQRAVWMTADADRTLQIHELRRTGNPQKPARAPDDLALPGDSYAIGDLVILPPAWHPHTHPSPGAAPRNSVVFDDAKGNLWAVDFSRGVTSMLEGECSRPLGLDDGSILVLVGPEKVRRWVRYTPLGSQEAITVSGMTDYVRSEREDVLSGPLRWVSAVGEYGAKDEVLLPGPTITRWSTTRYGMRSRDTDNGATYDGVEEGSLVGGVSNVTFGDCTVVVDPERTNVQVWSEGKVCRGYETEHPILWAGISRHGWIVWWDASGHLTMRHLDNPKKPHSWSLEQL